MRIRLTLDIERRRNPAPETPETPEVPYVLDMSGATIERADPHPEVGRPLGFRRNEDDQ